MDFTLPPEKLGGYQREHSPQMIAELKDLGVNFLMIHGYKGAGMATEAAGNSLEPLIEKVQPLFGSIKATPTRPSKGSTRW